MFWMGLWRLLFNHKLRSGNFGSPDQVTVHYQEFVRKAHALIVFGLVGILGHILWKNAILQLTFKSVPFFISFNPWILGGAAVLYVAVWIGFGIYRNKTINNKDSKGAVSSNLLQLKFQALIIIGTIALQALMPMTAMYMLPVWFRAIHIGILVFLVWETIKLIFYSAHYIYKGILTYSFYQNNHVYEVKTYKQLPEALHRLFIDRTKGFYHEHTGNSLGKERIDQFIKSVFADLTNIKDYQQPSEGIR